jgi:hypothetical protein
MPALLELQRAFAASLLSADDEAIGCHIADDGFRPGERLDIYRNTCRSTLIETLRMTYPAVDRLVGSDFFATVAGWFVESHPARSAYLNEYGGGFGDFLAGLEATSSVPYLADVARFEWALSIAANAADVAPLGTGALLAVMPEDHAKLVFEPHPSLSLLALAHPADHIADAVLSGDEAAMAEVDLSSAPVRLVVHRGPAGLEAQRLDARDYEFFARLCAGECLGALVEICGDNAPRLLADQLAKGRLNTFSVLP